MLSRNENGRSNKPDPITLLPDTNLQARLFTRSRYLAWMAAAIALMVLAGWQFNIYFFRQPFPGLPAMNPLTATLFVLSASSFLLLHSRNPTHFKRSLFIILAAVVFLVATIRLADALMGIEMRLDLLLYPRQLEIHLYDGHITRMTPNTAFCFLLVSFSLLLSYIRTKHKKIAQYFALAILLSAWLSILEYLFRAKPFGGALNYLTMAFTTAIAFLCFALAILFEQSDSGLMRQFTSKLSGSLTARLLIPGAIVIPSLLSLLRLHGHWAGIYDTESGTAIFTTVIIVIFLLLAWYITLMLNRRDMQDRAAEEKERSHEQEIAAIFHAAPDAIIVADEQDRIVEWNEAAEKLFGWSRAEVANNLLSETIIPADSRGAHRKWVQHSAEKGSSSLPGQTIELRAARKNGSEMELALRISEVMINDTKLFVGFARDITEEKLTEQKLRNFNDELSRRVIEKTKEIAEVLERLNDGFIAIDRNFCYTYMNKRAGEMTHRDPASMIGKNIWEEFPEAIGSPTYLAICKAMIDQVYVMNTDYFEPLDLWQENYIYPSQTGISVFIRDITEQKKTELAISEARKLADKLIDSLPGLFYFYDENGRFIRWNKEFERVTGYTAEEIATMHPRDFFHPKDHEYITERIQDVFRTGANDAETDFKTKDGRLIPYFFKAVLLTYEGNPCLLGFGINITERQNYEKELRASEQKYKLLFESNPLPMWMLSLPEYNVIDVNNAALEQYGYTREEFLSLDIANLRPDEDREEFRQKTDKTFREIHHSGIWRHRRKNGTILYVDIITYDIYYKGDPARFILANEVTEKYIAEEKLKESLESIRSLTEHLQKIREEERTHIAREIHDELGQQLTVLKMDIAWLNKKIDAKDDGIRAKISELISMIDATVKTVRRIASELRPSLLDDLGLVAAMEWHVQEFEKRSGIEASFTGLQMDRQLPDDVKIGVFRILQESLTNVARHSRASEVKVLFEQNEKEVILTIRDNGIGFGKDNLSKKTLGILGMKERASMLGGSYTMNGEPGRGTSISVIIPAKKADH